MRNIPFFTTENGVATLVLKEIPYKGEGYILVHGANKMEALLAECAELLRACGANRIFARGEGLSENLPVHAAVWKMTAEKALLPQTKAVLVPLTRETGARYRQLMNQKMRGVPCASTMEQRDLDALLQRGGGYFVREGDKTIGAGQVAGNEISLLASTAIGKGAAVVCALASGIAAPEIKVRVALENEKALALYKRLGFQMEELVEIWHVLR